MTNIDNKNTINEILAAFKFYDGIYKQNEINIAIELKDEITPALIMILEDLLSNPNVYIEDGDLYDHIYAVMLLGHFKKQSAHKLVIDIFSLPDNLPDKLFGDICTSNLPTILLNTCGGSVDHIKLMILDKKVDDYCRISACEALAYAVVEGYVQRKEVVELFGTLFTGDEADEISDFWGLLANIVCDLYPKEIIEIIEQAYEDGLIMPDLIPYELFEEVLDMGEDWCLEKLKKEKEMRSLNDIHGAMSWWSSFDQGHKKASSNAPTQVVNKKKKAKAKKKRKQAKKSRKKNRR